MTVSATASAATTSHTVLRSATDKLTYFASMSRSCMVRAEASKLALCDLLAGAKVPKRNSMDWPNNQLRAVCDVMLLPQYRRLNSLATSADNGRTPTPFNEGVRTWVATNKRPTSARATDAYVVLFELNGKIYFGELQMAGTRMRFIYGVDNTIVNDYSIRLNGTAVASIKQAVKF